MLALLIFRDFAASAPPPIFGDASLPHSKCADPTPRCDGECRCDVYWQARSIVREVPAGQQIRGFCAPEGVIHQDIPD